MKLVTGTRKNLTSQRQGLQPGSWLTAPATWAAQVKERVGGKRLAEAACGCILAIMALNLITVVVRKDLVLDEFAHIPSGVYHLYRGDFELNNEHPPLAKMISALPMFFFPIDAAGLRQILEQPNNSRYKMIEMGSRLPMIALAIGLGALIFIYTRRLFGARAGLFAVALFSLEPTVLAHGKVVHTDVPSALAFLLFAFTLHNYATLPTLRRAAILGVVSGLALVTKFSMLLIIPLLLVAALVFLWRGGKRARILSHIGIVAVVILLTINAAYYFQRRALKESDIANIASVFAPLPGDPMKIYGAVSTILPTDYIAGFCKLTLHNRRGHWASLLGDYRQQGWWYYFPVAFALKTTIPFLLISIAALGWLFWKIRAEREWRLLFLAVPLASYVAFSMMANINIGIRHFLPALPFLFVLGGGLLDQLLRLRARRAGVALVALSLAWVAVEAVRAYPNHLSYMNQLTWRHPRYHYLSDSNIEWGEDAGDLASYLRARGETKVHAALLGGNRTLLYHGVSPLDLLTPESVETRQARYVAIGASYLNGAQVMGDGKAQHLAEILAYRQRAPEAVFGDSIYLYLNEE